LATAIHNVAKSQDVFERFGRPSGLLEDAFPTSRQSNSRLQHRAERLSAIGAMTAEFAHQVRTPLASAMLYTSQLDISDPRQARVVNKIQAGLAELKRMASDMLGFAAGARAEQEPVNVQALFNDVCDCMDAQLKPTSNLRASVTDSNLTVAANKDAVKGALLNLVINADQASSSGVNILLHGHQFGSTIHLCVTDDGPGIPGDVQPRLFDAFFTTRPQGTGLGLSVVQAVAAAHGGKVSVNSSSLGSSFTLQIPLESHGDDTP
tara:strand:- start:43321 stop:44112 length:792 start_codon:yes stop_codon:yes gene_type:complete